MLHIAICDDDIQIASQIEEFTGRFFRTHCVDTKIRVYQSSENLRYDLQDGIYYDLLLLDIEMPGVDGMELAEHIHDDMAAARIIFITSHLEYAIEAYEFSVFRYIPKNKIDEKPYRTDRIPGYFVYSEGRKICGVLFNRRRNKICAQDIDTGF